MDISILIEKVKKKINNKNLLYKIKGYKLIEKLKWCSMIKQTKTLEKSDKNDFSKKKGGDLIKENKLKRSCSKYFAANITYVSVISLGLLFALIMAIIYNYKLPDNFYYLWMVIAGMFPLTEAAKYNSKKKHERNGDGKNGVT